MISYENVSKDYPGGARAVAGVNLTIAENSITVFVGSSGCGKTTLLRMINRMVDPTSGRVLLDGTDIAAQDPVKLRRSIGYVMQNGGLLPHRTVIDNVALVPRLNGSGKKEACRRAEEMLSLVGLDTQLAKRYPRQLSGGQQQRVGVARALAANPRVLLMDEPFGAVDPVVRAELQEELLRIHREIDTTIVFVTHDIDEALKLGDRIIIFREHGQVAQDGTGAEILTNPADDFVARFVGLQERQLRTKQVGDKTVVLDANGRATGVLAR
ncbi:ABC transporter ATP-binding protein [Dermabacteraceae bacterium P13138]